MSAAEVDIDEVFRAISDPTRRGIVRLLRGGSRTAGQLAEAFPLAKSTLSAHFASLRRAGLITGVRRGTSIVYQLNAAALRELADEVTSWVDRPDPIAAARIARRLAVTPLPGTPPLAAERTETRRPAPSAVAGGATPQHTLKQGAN
jgi:ArsR family transcriptional regulator, arsenate/arsenite/antimonite-responsive transcriptional repressor